MLFDIRRRRPADAQAGASGGRYIQSMPRRGILVTLLLVLALTAGAPATPAGATTGPKRCGTISVSGRDFAVRGHLLPCRFSRRKSRAYLAEGTHPPGWSCRRYPPRLTRIAFQCRKGGRSYYAVRR